jgi:penicillin-binding protein-related factor A (putative recombinase)
MKKSEQKFTTYFQHWLKERVFVKGGVAFEIKHTRGKNLFPFSEVKDHQINALLAVKSVKGLVYKISDSAIGFKPFDCFMMRECESYIVIKYPNFFCLINPENFIQEKERTNRKSLTSERAKEIANLIVNLK